MIKIVRKNVRDYYRCLCTNCRCEFYFDDSDLNDNISYDGEKNKYVICPKCNAFIKENDYEVYKINEDAYKNAIDFTLYD